MKDKQIIIKVDSREKRKFQEGARLSFLSISSFIRKTILDKIKELELQKGQVYK